MISKRFFVCPTGSDSGLEDLIIPNSANEWCYGVGVPVAHSDKPLTGFWVSPRVLEGLSLRRLSDPSRFSFRLFEKKEPSMMMVTEVVQETA
jgi:hypothetical protein